MPAGTRQNRRHVIKWQKRLDDPRTAAAHPEGERPDRLAGLRLHRQPAEGGEAVLAAHLTPQRLLDLLPLVIIRDPVDHPVATPAARQHHHQAGLRRGAATALDAQRK